jgi:hypothetical protein
MPHKFDIDPADSDAHMVTCLACRRKYHASERGCDCEDDDRAGDWETYKRLKGLKECEP